jgi:hypothetical protein
MSVINATPLLAAAGGDYQISRSVRLRSSASATLSRTFATTGTSLYIRTFSFWVKRGSLANARYTLFAGYDGSSTNNFDISFDSSTTSQDAFTVRIGGTPANESISSAKFRDPSAWYHFVVSIDTTQATAANRVKLYVNNTQITAFNSQTLPALNQQVQFGLANANNRIGTWWNAGSNFFDGYLTEINFIDGQALTPSSFGETDAITGVWKPKKYAGTYGTNGFYLNFSDNSSNTATTIGKDNSGNGNNWTPNNISVTSGATYDSMIDVPTLYADGGNGRGNYCTLNPLNKAGSQGTVSGGNLTFSGALGSQDRVYGSIGMSSGQWYWEVVVTAFAPSGNGYLLVGVSRATTPSTTTYDGTALSYLGGNDGSVSGYKSNRNVPANTSYGASWTTNDVIGVALDMDAGTLTFYKNGTSQGVAFSSINSTYPGTYFPIIWNDGTAPNATYQANFGQRPFAYTPPTGFKALNTQNLPAPTILKGNKYFDVVTRTTSGSSGATISSLGFQPDFLWSKLRNSASNHYLWDSVRGVSKYLASNQTNAEGTDANFLLSFNSNGYTMGTGEWGAGNSAAEWAWKANGSAVTNTSGSITSQVNAGTSQGFSVVTYTGTGANATVGHGLGVAPAMVIVKNRNASGFNWVVWHKSLPSGLYYLNLNTTAAQDTAATVWNSTVPSSTVFSIGTSPPMNTSGNTQVAYCFSEVAGFSKFGSYTGNGSTDGPFVFCGFRPRYVMIKRTDTTNDWMIHDTARDTYNAVSKEVYANLSSAEAVIGDRLDITANGFKLRTTGPAENANGGTYIFAAFAEAPFKNSLAR